MSVIIRLQNLPLTANSIDIRTFFRGLAIPDGGVHIVGGNLGDAFIAFSTDEDARQAMQMSGSNLQESSVRLLLSSRNEMFKVIEQARQKTLGIVPNNAMNTGMPGSVQPNPAGNAAGPPRDTDNSTSSPFQNHQSQILQSSNQSHLPMSNHNQSMIGASGLTNSTNAFGIPNMTAFTGVMNNIPQQGISPFGPMHNNIQSQMNPMMGQAQGSSMFPQSGLTSQLPSPGRGQNQNQAQPFNMMSPFGAGVAALSQTQQSHIAQNAMAFPSGISGMSGSATMAGHAQQHNLMTHNVGNSVSALGLPHQILGQGSNGALSGQYQGGSQRLTVGMGNNGVGMPNSAHQAMSGFQGQNTGFGRPNNTDFARPTNTDFGRPTNTDFARPNNTSAVARDGSMGSGNSASLGVDDYYGSAVTGISTGAGRGRVSRFSQHDTNLDDDGPTYQGRGRSSVVNAREMPNREMPRDKGIGFGSTRPEAGAPSGVNRARDSRDQQYGNTTTTGRDRAERNVRRSRSRSRDRKDSRRPIGRGGDRDRNRDEPGRDIRRHRRTKSKSRSRSRERDRSGRIGNSRRNSSLESREKNSSPEKNKQNDPDDSKNSSGNDDVLVINEGIEEEFPCVKLSGIARDASMREIKEFLRVDFRGGNEGIVRNYEEGIAFIRLDKPSDFSKAFRQSGRKMGNSSIRVEGISLEAWISSHTLRRPEREQVKDVDTRDRQRPRDNERERDRDRDRGDRDGREPRDRDRDREYRPRDQDRVNDRGNGSANVECCLRIGGLPPAFSQKDITIRILGGVKKWAFSQIVIVSDQNDYGRPVANAYVQFMSAQEAQKAIDLIARLEEGKSLRTQIVGIEQLGLAQQMGSGGLGGFKEKDPSSRYFPTEAKSLFELDVGKEAGSSSVMLRGVPSNMSERDIVDFFSDIGLTPMNVRMLDNMNGSRNGQVICEFQDSSRARRATTKDGMDFGRSTISVQLLPPRGNRSGGDFDGTLSPSLNGMTGGLSVGLSTGGRGGPRGGGPILGMRPSRFGNGNPQHRSPNPFVQAMQQGMRGPSPRMRGAGGFLGRGRGGPRMNSRPPLDVAQVSEDQLTVTSSFHLESLFEKPGCVVAVTNIPYSATMDDILRFLDGILKNDMSRDRIIRRYNEFQQATGDARIAFDTPFDAKRAHDLLQGSTMWNRQLTVSIPSTFLDKN